MGSNLIREKAAAHQIIGTGRRAAQFNSSVYYRLDLLDRDAREKLIEQHQPDYIIHTAAEPNTNYCEQHAGSTQVINTEVPIQLAQFAKRRSIPFVFTSTDLVFDGTRGNYDESDNPEPINVYGKQKLVAEQGIAAEYPQALICRLPLLYGMPNGRASNYLHRLISEIKQGRPQTLFADEFRSMNSAGNVIRAIFHLLAQERGGIFHLGGDQRRSRFDFGKKVVEVFKLERSLISAVSQKDFPMAAPRPADVSLNSEKLLATGFVQESMETELIKLRSAFTN